MSLAALLACWPGCLPGRAQGNLNASAPPLTVSVVDFNANDEAAGQHCAELVRDQLIRSQRYHVLPDWYTRQKLGTLPQEPSWETLQQRLPSDYFALGQLTLDPVFFQLSLIVFQPATHEIVFADTLHRPRHQLADACAELANRFLGRQQPLAPKSPALAAGLSLTVPGAGHFYLGEPANIFTGLLFILAYGLTAYAGLAGQGDARLLTREQWGAILLTISLTDVMMAYFFAQQQAERHAPSF